MLFNKELSHLTESIYFQLEGQSPATMCAEDIWTSIKQMTRLFKAGVGNLRPPGRIRPARPFDTALEVIYKHTQHFFKRNLDRKII